MTQQHSSMPRAGRPEAFGLDRAQADAQQRAAQERKRRQRNIDIERQALAKRREQDTATG